MAETEYGWTGELERRSPSHFNSPDVPCLRIDVWFESDTRLHVKIGDAAARRWQTPYPQVPVPPNRRARAPQYTVSLAAVGADFRLVVRRRDGQLLFDSGAGVPLVFTDQIISWSAQLPTRHVYGLGEHWGRLRRAGAFSFYDVTIMCIALYTRFRTLSYAIFSLFSFTRHPVSGFRQVATVVKFVLAINYCFKGATPTKGKFSGVENFDSRTFSKRNILIQEKINPYSYSYN